MIEIRAINFNTLKRNWFGRYRLVTVGYEIQYREIPNGCKNPESVPFVSVKSTEQLI